MKKIVYQSFFVLCTIGLIVGCKKNFDTIQEDAILSSIENVRANETFADLFTNISSAATENPSVFENISASSSNTLSSINTEVSGARLTFGLKRSCATITVSPKYAWPKIVTFDFGTGCTEDSVLRKGKIIAVYTDKLRNAGAKVTITFDNYYVNNTKIEGTKIITNNGKNTSGNSVFNVEVAKSKLLANGKTVTYNASKTIEWIKGEDTSNAEDDEFAIMGSENGVNSMGNVFSGQITKALIKKVSCKFIVAGTLEIKTENKTRTLDYGNGDCDAAATLTVNGISKPITLKK